MENDDRFTGRVAADFPSDGMDVGDFKVAFKERVENLIEFAAWLRNRRSSSGHFFSLFLFKRRKIVKKIFFFFMCVCMCDFCGKKYKEEVEIIRRK